MLPGLADVLGVLTLILPGFIAYRFVLLRRTDATQRSSFWQITEILEHSVYVHAFGIGLSLVAVWLLGSIFGITTHARELLQIRPSVFFDKYFAEGTLWLTLYTLYVIIASSIIGAYNTPERVSTKIVNGVSRFTEWTANRHMLLSWIPVPDKPFSVEPIWYSAFDPDQTDAELESSAMTESESRNNPFVIVTMKGGGIYVGEIRSIPIVSDIELAKDFLMQRASYYAYGNIYQDGEELHSLDNDIDAVLLNTSNVESIRLYYDQP